MMKFYPIAAAFTVVLSSAIFGIADEWNEFMFFAVIGWIFGLHEQRLDSMRRSIEKIHDKIYGEGFDS